MRSSFQESFSPMRRSQRDEVLCIATTPNVFLDNSPGFRSCLQITIHLFRCIKQISWVMEHDLKALQREREREKEEGRYKTSQINRICSILLKKGSSVSLGKEDSKIHVFFGYYLSLVSFFLPFSGRKPRNIVRISSRRGSGADRKVDLKILPKAKGWLQMAGIGISCLRSFLPWGW